MTPLEIYCLRKSLDLTADQMAAKLGLTGKNRDVAIYRLESGQRTPSPEVMDRLQELAKESRSGIKC